MKKITFIVIIVLLVVSALAWNIYRGYESRTLQTAITDFSSCASAGFPVMESYPRQCRTSDGRSFTEVIPTGIPDLIVIDSPAKDAVVTSPIRISGRARGNWYFEASFPVTLKDSKGTILAQVPAQAQGEWMTTDFVPFDFELPFTQPAEATDAVLIFQKDNPSGLPEYDASVEIALTLVATSTSGTVSGGCLISGCSSQICAEEEMMSNCEYREEYSCYRTAECKRQVNGQCGWTQSPALLQCLADAR